MFEYNNYSEFNIILPILFPFDIQGYNKITHKMHETHSINFWKKNAKTHQKCLSTYVYRKKKLGQICQSYDVINIFVKWEVTIPIRLFDRTYFSGS
jgi:hypothetical protein